MKSRLYEIIEADIYRHGIDASFSSMLFLKILLFIPNPGMRFLLIFRYCQYYRGKNKILFYFYFRWLRRLKYKYGFDISYRTQIGKGFYIGHFGGIVIHGDTIIGENCNISQGVTIGIMIDGKLSGTPIIGNKVFIGPGAAILGGCTVGDNALIGTNSVVTFDVASSSVVAASKSEVISQRGSGRYILRTKSGGTNET